VTCNIGKARAKLLSPESEPPEEYDKHITLLGAMVGGSMRCGSRRS
jgi:hypothetical protein